MNSVTLKVCLSGCSLAWLGVSTMGCAESDQAKETVEVLVARQDIRAGTVFSEPEKLFKRVSYLKEHAPKEAISDFSNLKGKMAVRALAEDQPVKEKDVMLPKAITDKLAPGTRAISVSVFDDGPISFAPGLRVDVLATPRKAKEDSKTTVVVEDLLVLGIQGPDFDIKKHKLRVALAVTLEQAEKLTFVLDDCDLRLVVRKLPGQ